jgi:hypothetical protein
MSLYRQAGGFSSRALVAALVVGALVGALAGFLAGRGSVEEPSAAEVVADAREALGPVELGLEQIPIEYEGALRGNRVIAQTEYEAAQATSDRTQAALAETAEDMEAINPSGYAAATRAVDRVSAAIDAVVPPARIEALVALASRQVEVLAGGSE